MPSTLAARALVFVRVLLAAGGLLVAGLTVYYLATMPPAPPDSDGFVTGLAYFFGSVVFVLALGVASLGVVLPSLLGVDDSLGFNRGQRLLLKGAAVLVGGGFLVGLAFGLVTELQFGFFLWLATILLGVFVVVLAAGWRAAEAVVRVVLRYAGTA